MPFLLRLLTALVVLSKLVHADEPPLRVAVTPDSLRFAWPPSAGKTEIRELPLHTSAAGEGHVLWSGDGPGATVPRFDGARDRLFAKFELRADGKALGAPQCVTDFSALPRRTNSRSIAPISHTANTPSGTPARMGSFVQRRSIGSCRDAHAASG